jgi:hypothetical protein
MSSKTAVSVSLVALIVVTLLSDGLAADADGVEALLAKATLVQEIDCAAENKDLLFLEFPNGVSQVQSILGTPCRVLDNSSGDAKFFAYRLGEDKGLKAGGHYILTVDYPEDVSRAMYVANWGSESVAGFATGEAIGDVLKARYVPNNPESLKYPLSGRMQTWMQYFNLHDHTPEIKRTRGVGVRPLKPADGFWVIIAQPAAVLDPLSAGAAVSKIRLYEVTDPEALKLELRLPPEGLPRRHVYSREEMADSAVSTGHNPADNEPNMRGVTEIADWFEYKMNVMGFLGVNTFAKDLLEFGHNQGWDSTAGGGNDWVYQSSTPQLWEQILDRAARHKLSVLPYYEYRGSSGATSLALGSQHRAMPLSGGRDYTHIHWCEGINVDITDPDTVADFTKILDLTITRYKDKVEFVGAWLRSRPSAMPISFNDNNLKRFAAEANDGRRITRSHLQSDTALLDRYYDWWFDQRRAFLEAVATHLRDKVGPDQVLVYTNEVSEPGRALQRSITGEGKVDGWQWMHVVVTDDFDKWATILSDESHYQYIKPYDIGEVIRRQMHLRSLAAFSENWDRWENRHSAPPEDPHRYRDSDRVMMTYGYNRLYTVGSSEPFDAYRSAAGLAIVRHYSLNENEMNVGDQELLGYFVADVERAGPFCMLAEARAVAHGDPWHLGSLFGNTSSRGFPQYVRNFHTNFLALPALPSTLVPNAASDPEVYVRQIPTDGHGTYLAIVNTGFVSKQNVRITLPGHGKVIDAVTGQAVAADGRTLTVSLYPGQLRSLHLP